MLKYVNINSNGKPVPVTEEKRKNFEDNVEETEKNVEDSNQFSIDPDFLERSLFFWNLFRQ